MGHSGETNRGRERSSQREEHPKHPSRACVPAVELGRASRRAQEVGLVGCLLVPRTPCPRMEIDINATSWPCLHQALLCLQSYLMQLYSAVRPLSTIILPPSANIGHPLCFLHRTKVAQSNGRLRHCNSCTRESRAPGRPQTRQRQRNPWRGTVYLGILVQETHASRKHSTSTDTGARAPRSRWLAVISSPVETGCANC